MPCTSKRPEYAATRCCMLPRGSSQWVWPSRPMECPREATHTIFRASNKSIDVETTWRACCKCYDAFSDDTRASKVTPHGYPTTEWDDVLDIDLTDEMTIELHQEMKACMAGKTAGFEDDAIDEITIQLNEALAITEAETRVKDVETYLAHTQQVADSEKRVLPNTPGDEDYERCFEVLKANTNRNALGESTEKLVTKEGKNREPSTQSKYYERVVANVNDYLAEVALSTAADEKPESYQRAAAITGRVLDRVSLAAVTEARDPKLDIATDGSLRLMDSVAVYLEEVESRIDGETPESIAASEEYKQAMDIAMRIFH